MQLSVKAVALALGIVLAAGIFLGGVLALLFPVWGARYMEVVGSIYPGVGGVGFGPVIVATLYALVDGLVCGAVFAWLHNRLAGPPRPTATA